MDKLATKTFHTSTQSIVPVLTSCEGGGSKSVVYTPDEPAPLKGLNDNCLFDP